MPHLNVSFHQGPEESLDLDALSQALTEIITEKLGVKSQYVSMTIQPVAKQHWSEQVLEKYINQPGYQVIKPVSY
ncbi:MULTISPECIES: tautomerase family protein [Pantoea]|uniref:Tautomerase family protein n=1 Tax=Pantoea trifolii TaxID=2968030 RepID=A0ABT1VQB0_9GAMM|nr:MULTISPECIES: tautomerase family protein [unclassified Pantoea]MCQ8229720.1 tautomerase family protein [Pantoea sp. MMK2]MCQ8238436.1 tautomerase family protein [Pantoea sp. MMK3]MCW6033715.1 tautomerase family protein [Pantoea sp. JK]